MPRGRQEMMVRVHPPMLSQSNNAETSRDSPASAAPSRREAPVEVREWKSAERPNWQCCPPSDAPARSGEGVWAINSASDLRATLPRRLPFSESTVQRTGYCVGVFVLPLVNVPPAIVSALKRRPAELCSLKVELSGGVEANLRRQRFTRCSLLAKGCTSHESLRVHSEVKRSHERKAMNHTDTMFTV